ncbi:MAG: ADP-ribosylglycohydrolase family protein [Chloroflexi bacterium]|nr:ADP-ribosylglycohydrolase family protein [Chloroflexota bacterium]
MASPNNERLARARIALEGLSVGDAFGEKWFFIPVELMPGLMAARALPGPPWTYTDDTQMALSIYANLRDNGEISQTDLAMSFARRYNPYRKYGAAMRGLFEQFKVDAHWKDAAPGLFGGTGSYGNGAAMRIAPLGAYFADDINAVIDNARLASEVTHAHPEGIAGGIAVAVATALAWQHRENPPTPADFLASVLPHIPRGTEVENRVKSAHALCSERPSLLMLVKQLGNGGQISAQDTVGYCLWMAAHHLDSYEEALWATIQGGGDIDTNCAIVGGIVSMVAGLDGIPAQWREHREPLPSWAVDDQ